MSRPTKPQEQKLTQRYLIRLTPPQEKVIKARIQAQGKTRGMATLIRQLALAAVPDAQ